MASHVNIGVRHILPIYCMLSLVAAAGLIRVCNRTANAGLGIAAVVTLVTWMAVSGASYHPDYLAYFNEFASGNPEAVLVDSDLDWGQELVMLSHRLRGVTAIHTNFRDYYSSYSLYHMPPEAPIEYGSPSPGWNVVSPTAAKHQPPGIIPNGLDFESLAQAGRNTVPWYDRIVPTDHVGPLRLYLIPPDSRKPE